MGMPPDQFRGLRLHHIAKRELAILLGDRCLEDDMKEKVAELLAKFVKIAGIQCLNHLVGFFDEGVPE
jgi:hypothetical protein